MFALSKKNKKYTQTHRPQIAVNVDTHQSLRILSNEKEPTVQKVNPMAVSPVV